MAGMVTLIRHAEPRARACVASESWPLSEDGRRAARGLRGALPAGVILASSPELKAIETLCLAADVEQKCLRLDPRFGEVDRDEPFDDHYRSRRRAWVSNRLDDRHAGWETPAEAADRFQHGVDDLDSDVVVATHGMVMMAWLVARDVVAPGVAAANFWDRLTFPDLVHVPPPDDRNR